MPMLRCDFSSWMSVLRPNGSAFKQAGLQIAAGVPLQIGEAEDFSTFRIGLFGLDKWGDVDRAVERFEDALKQVLS